MSLCCHDVIRWRKKQNNPTNNSRIQYHNEIEVQTIVNVWAQYSSGTDPLQHHAIAFPRDADSVWHRGRFARPQNGDLQLGAQHGRTGKHAGRFHISAHATLYQDARYWRNNGDTNPQQNSEIDGHRIRTAHWSHCNNVWRPPSLMPSFQMRTPSFHMWSCHLRIYTTCCRIKPPIMILHLLLQLTPGHRLQYSTPINRQTMVSLQLIWVLRDGGQHPWQFIALLTLFSFFVFGKLLVVSSHNFTWRYWQWLLSLSHGRLDFACECCFLITIQGIKLEW